MEVRSLTFQRVDANGVVKAKELSTNKWTNLDDAVYNNLAELMSNDDKERIADLLNIFYYLIICYSKTCFKKDANWESNYREFTHYISQKKYKIGNTFDYALANDLNSHTLLLKMQKQLYAYRKQYLTYRCQTKLQNIKLECKNNYVNITFFTNEKKQEMMDFINESLYDIVKFIIPPVKFISSDVLNKINKYKNIKSKTRVNLPAKYNEDVLKAILGSDADITRKESSNSSKMIEFTFTSSTTQKS